MSSNHIDLVMDLSNFARHTHDGHAKMSLVLGAVEEVVQSLDGRKYQLKFFADSNLHSQFSKNESVSYQKFVRKHHVESSASGVQADFDVLDYAEMCFDTRGRYAIVLSQDGFWQDEFSRYHSWLYEVGKGRLFGGSIHDGKSKWLLRERDLRAAGLRYSRKLAEFLDQEFPTPRSIARESNVELSQLTSLIEMSGLAVAEIEILTSEVASTFRAFLASVKKYSQSVMELDVAKGMNATEVAIWLNDAGYEFFLRGDAPFVELDVSVTIDQWSKSSSGTIRRYWLQKAVAEKNSQDLALALTSLDTEGDLAALKIGSFCGQLLEMGRVADWSVLKGLTSSDVEWLFQLLSIAGLSIDLDAVPKKTVASLPGTLRLLKIARELKNELSDENVIAYFDLLFSFVSDKSNGDFVIENDESFQLATEALSDLVTSRSMSLSKKTWIHVADLLELLAAETDLVFLAHYMSDNWEKSLLNGAGCSLKTRNLLHRRFFSDVLDAPWLTPDVFRDVAKSPSEAKRLIVGDLAPLLTSSKFVEAAHRSRDEVFELSSPTASLACTVIVSSTVGKLAGELSGLHAALTNVLNSRNGK
jgi:hypothetical protein